ncbi:MAG: adenylyltransferase/cytidyltransferase family protein, partial [Phycisphaerae bacterium]
MRTIQNINDVDTALHGAVLTIGNFDGVHRGHVAILEQCRRLAESRPTVAITFEPHPATLLTPDRVPPRLTSAEEKLRILAEHEMAEVIVLRTDRALLETSA